MFDTKPNLNSGKFEQFSGDTLTLSGVTNFVTTAGGDLRIDGVSIKELTGGTGGSVNAANGLSLSGNTIVLGGPLTGTTDIDFNGHRLILHGLDETGGYCTSSYTSGGYNYVEMFNTGNTSRSYSSQAYSSVCFCTRQVGLGGDNCSQLLLLSDGCAVLSAGDASNEQSRIDMGVDYLRLCYTNQTSSSCVQIDEAINLQISGANLEFRQEPGSLGGGFVDGNVNDALTTGGLTYVIGYFSQYNTNTVNYIVALNGDGTPATNVFGSGFDNGPYTIAQTNDNYLLIGGEFTEYNGNTDYPSLIKIDTAGNVNTGFVQGSVEGVYDIGVSGDTALIVGFFENYDGVETKYIVRIFSDGSIDPTFTSPFSGETDSIITKVKIINDKIYVSGYFDGGSIPRVYRLNSDGTFDNTWTAHDFDSDVYAIELVDDKLFFGGWFNSYSGETHNYIVALNDDGSVNNTVNFGSGFDSGIYDIIYTGGIVYIGSESENYDGQQSIGVVALNSDATVNHLFGADGIASSKLLVDSSIILFPVSNGNGVLFNNSFVKQDYNIVPGEKLIDVQDVDRIQLNSLSIKSGDIDSSCSGSFAGSSNFICNGDFNVIVGGADHSIDGADNAVILGGAGIFLDSTYNEHAVASRLAIYNQPDTGDNSMCYLVRDPSTGIVKQFSGATGGGGGGNTCAGNGLNKLGNVIRLGGSLTGCTTIQQGNFGLSFGCNSAASGQSANAFGFCSKANANFSHAEGRCTTAAGCGSHSEGDRTRAQGYASHAEGRMTCSIGCYSHAEGCGSFSCGDGSHAEGRSSCAIGINSHAEGFCTRACGMYSHSEGSRTCAIGAFSHVEGYCGCSCGTASHAQNKNSEARGYASHAGGVGYFNVNPTIAGGCGSFIHSVNTLSQTAGHGALADRSAILGGCNHNIASGNTGAAIIGGNTIKLTGSSYVDTLAAAKLALMSTPATGNGSMCYLVRDPSTGIIKQFSGGGGGTGTTNASNGLSKQGDYIVLGGSLTGNTCVDTSTFSFAFGSSAVASGTSSVAFGVNTIAGGACSFAHGSDARAFGLGSTAEGTGTRAFCQSSHAEGASTWACGTGAHSEGCQTCALANASHSEGRLTRAAGQNSHAEGQSTCSIGNSSHSEGSGTCSIGENSHAEGCGTKAGGCNSHSQNTNTCASGASSHAGGFGYTTGGRYIFATGCAAFNHSSNDGSAIAGEGANADYSAILGGLNHHIDSGNIGAVIIGGCGIKLTGTTYINTTAVENLAIMGPVVTATTENVMYVVRDMNSGILILTTGGTSGGGGGSVNAINGLTKDGDNIGLGGTLTGNTVIDGNLASLFKISNVNELSLESNLEGCMRFATGDWFNGISPWAITEHFANSGGAQLRGTVNSQNGYWSSGFNVAVDNDNNASYASLGTSGCVHINSYSIQLNLQKDGIMDIIIPAELRINSDTNQLAGYVLTSQGPGLPPVWAPVSGGTSGGTVNAANGLSKAGDDIVLGGDLTGTTIITTFNGPLIISGNTGGYGLTVCQGAQRYYGSYTDGTQTREAFSVAYAGVGTTFTQSAYYLNPSYNNTCCNGSINVHFNSVRLQTFHNADTLTAKRCGFVDATPYASMFTVGYEGIGGVQIGSFNCNGMLGNTAGWFDNTDSTGGVSKTVLNIDRQNGTPTDETGSGLAFKLGVSGSGETYRAACFDAVVTNVGASWNSRMDFYVGGDGIFDKKLILSKSGLTYNDDYSACFHARSIPDIEWITNNVGSGSSYTFLNGVCDYGSNQVGLGGPLTTNTTIDGDGFAMCFSNVCGFTVVGGDPITLNTGNNSISLIASQCVCVIPQQYLILENLPTSSGGLPAGAVWNDAGTLKIA